MSYRAQGSRVSVPLPPRIVSAHRLGVLRYPSVIGAIDPAESTKTRLAAVIQDVLVRAKKSLDEGEPLDANADPASTYERIKLIRGMV
jgi:hypothetical protein